MTKHKKGPQKATLQEMQDTNQAQYNSTGNCKRCPP